MLRRGRARIICKKIQRILKKGNMVWYKRNIRSAVGAEMHFTGCRFQGSLFIAHAAILIKNGSDCPNNRAMAPKECPLYGAAGVIATV